MSDKPDGEMDEMEFLRANFFSSDADFAAAQREKPKKRRVKAPDDIKALRWYVRLMRDAPIHHHRAALRYLADRFLTRPAPQAAPQE